LTLAPFRNRRPAQGPEGSSGDAGGFASRALRRRPRTATGDRRRPVLGHLLTTVQPRGASAVWVPGGAGTAVGLALDAGLRFEDFPLLLCWSRPFADFERYLPISPGLI
jgi:hypothetical protein